MAVKAEAKLFREQKTAAKDAHKAKLSARTLRFSQTRIDSACAALLSQLLQRSSQRPFSELCLAALRQYWHALCLREAKQGRRHVISKGHRLLRLSEG
jgi:ABC-type transporter Mla MlaB component